MTAAGDTPSATQEPDDPTEGRARRWRAIATDIVAPWVLGAVAVVLGAYHSGVPGLWRDEAATISAAQRTLPQLWEMLGHYDAVHGLYYSFMSCWVDVFGASAFSVRFPSALAVGLTVTATAWLGRMLLGRWWGLLAGFLVMAMPRVMWAAVEARSTALTMLAVVAAVAFVTAAVRSGHRRWWLGAGLAMLVTAAMSAVAVAGLIALPVALAVQRVSARAWRWFAGVSMTAAVGFLPIGLAAVSQREQVSWIPPLTWDAVVTMPSDVLLWGTPYGVPVILWGVIAASLIVATAGVLRGRLPAHTWRPGASLALLTSWLVVPVATVGIASGFGIHLYYPRYLTFMVPAIALLVTMALAAVNSRVLAAAVAAITLAASVLPYQYYRSESSKVDTRVMAQWIGEHSEPGDAVVFGDEIPTTGSTRILAICYPEDLKGLKDVRLRESAADAGTLFPLDRPFTADLVHDVDRVFWVVQPGRWKAVQGFGAVLRSAGFEQVEDHSSRDQWHIYVYERRVGSGS